MVGIGWTAEEEEEQGEEMYMRIEITANRVSTKYEYPPLHWNTLLFCSCAKAGGNNHRELIVLSGGNICRGGHWKVRSADSGGGGNG